jgi:hypothetical protein
MHFLNPRGFQKFAHFSALVIVIMFPVASDQAQVRKAMLYNAAGYFCSIRHTCPTFLKRLVTTLCPLLKEICHRAPRT